jgi:hypothetical protein
MITPEITIYNSSVVQTPVSSRAQLQTLSNPFYGKPMEICPENLCGDEIRGYKEGSIEGIL